MASLKQRKKATVIYDGECGMCSAAARWINRFARAGQIETLPCQSAERKQRFPNMDEERCLEAIQLVMPDGAIYSGEEALPHVLKRLHGWRWMAGVFRIPGVGYIAPPLYRRIAQNRLALSAFLGRKPHISKDSAGPDCACEPGAAPPKSTE